MVVTAHDGAGRGKRQSDDRLRWSATASRCSRAGAARPGTGRPSRRSGRTARASAGTGVPSRARTGAARRADPDRRAARPRAGRPFPSRTPRTSIASQMSAIANSRILNPPPGIGSSRPSWARRSSASRTGVREACSRGTSVNSASRSPGPEIAAQQHLAQREDHAIGLRRRIGGRSWRCIHVGLLPGPRVWTVPFSHAYSAPIGTGNRTSDAPGMRLNASRSLSALAR